MRRRRSGAFKKAATHDMTRRKTADRPSFHPPKIKWPSFRPPKIRVDWMNAAIAFVLLINVGLAGFGIRQCAADRAGRPKPARPEAPAASAPASVQLREAGPRSAASHSAGPAAASTAGGGSGKAVRRTAAAAKKPRGPVQVEVLNGCGVPKIADRFTEFLRRKGYDVVRADNYESYNVAASLVIDRRGDLPSARKLAETLGVARSGVLSEVHDMYMVDATVVLGKDFRTLPAWKTIMEKRGAAK